ncbi:TonB-dependent receptor plug domain-containing protein [methane-oxidizing endosymbiont of Gigantopelta aegis]|uniref:TonB-dependent receptor plug domain-containing protein n=1 Tax=methane-oxidizing endosymbiont of Gigantopelta aegis TaxID=2794938 RepID=UPI0018DB2089|nr:TonB-dependent receptor [methane-oxidizing endosymbiont of Gigantopelta aegis]
MIFLNQLAKKVVYSSFMFSVGMTNAYAKSDVPEDLFALSPAELASIPVTIASGTAKKLIHSAAVTSVITADEIDRMGATDLHEVLQTVPGMVASIQPVTNDYIYSLRGINNSTGSRVLFMMNGTRINVPYKGSLMAGMEIPVEAIQRIEVIRGPGSALYGADAFAGVVNIITKKAKDIDGTVMGIRGGSYDTQSIWGQQSGQLLGWDIAASLQFSHNNVDDKRIVEFDLQSQLDQQLGTSASLAPGPMQTQAKRWNAHLNAQRKYIAFNFWAYANVDLGTRAGAGGALDNRGNIDGESYLFDLRFSSEDWFQDWELKAKATYLETEINGLFFYLPAGSVAPLDAQNNLNLTNFVKTQFFSDGMKSQIGLKNQVASSQFTTVYRGWKQHLWQFSAGYRYEGIVARESRNYGVGVSSPGGALVDLTGTGDAFLGDHHRDIWSFVLQDEWQIAPDWHLTAGIRYDEYSDFGSTFNPRAALIWDVSPQLTTKLLYGQAFRAPSFLEQFQKNSQLFAGNPALRPEEIETVELVFDYRPDEVLRTTMNIYYYKIRDSISSVESGLVAEVSNQPGVDAYGAEFEWDWRFFLPNWRFKGNYAWQQARDLATKTCVAWQPEHKLYSALSWQFLPQWQLQTQVNWVGHRFINDQGNRPDLTDYATMDLTLNSKRLLGVIDLTGSVRNLLDSKGRDPAISTYPNYIPIPRRSFYLEMKVNF